MTRLVVVENLALHGVMQEPGAPDDALCGVQYGGWALPYMDEVMYGEIAKGMGRTELLLGRRSCGNSPPTGPIQAEPDRVAEVLTSTERHVASTTLTEPLPWLCLASMLGPLRHAQAAEISLRVTRATAATLTRTT